MLTVYVLVAETGEYDEYCTGICGVFFKQEDADKVCAERAAAAKKWKDWHNRMLTELYKIRRNKGIYSQEQRDQAAERVGEPKPPYVSGERFEVVKVPLNQPTPLHEWVMINA